MPQGAFECHDRGFVEAVVADARARLRAVGDPVIHIGLTAGQLSVCAGASLALMAAVLKALR